MGDVVNQAAKLSAYGCQTYLDQQLMASADIYGNLNEHNRGLLNWNVERRAWQGWIHNVMMEEWFQANCK